MRRKKPNIVFIICLIVLVAAVAAAAGYKMSQKQRGQVYEDLSEIAVNDTLPDTEEGSEAENAPEIPVDFVSLQAENPDIYAWITIPDTNVNYPVLHSTEGDEDYYLDHTVDGAEGLPGSIYTQYSYNKDLETDKVTVIYGHNMRDESMFGCLKHYQDETYRSEHSTVMIYTPEHIYTYRVVYAVTYDDRHILGTYYNCEDSADYENFLESLQTERKLPSWLEEPFEVTAEDRMIVLSTCNGNSSQRYLIGAVLTDEE